MALLAQILGTLAGRSATTQQRRDTFLDMATAIIQGHPGGLAGLVQEFTAAGLGREASSWVGAGHNLPISAEQLGQVLGQKNLRNLGEQFSVTADSASAGLATLLPALIDHLTPSGQVDSKTPLTAALNALRGRFNL